jgi:hypothetical protein
MHIVFNDDEIANFYSYRIFKESRGSGMGWVDRIEITFRIPVVKKSIFRSEALTTFKTKVEVFEYVWDYKGQNNNATQWSRTAENLEFQQYLRNIVLFKNKSSDDYIKFLDYLKSKEIKP